MNASREFAEGLRTALPVWQAEGIVTPGAARALVARYDLDPGTAPPPAREIGLGRFAAAAAVAVVLMLGGVLLLSGIGDGVVLPLTALAAAFAATPLVVGPQLAVAAQGVRTLGRILFYLSAYALAFVRGGGRGALPERARERGARLRAPAAPPRRRRRSRPGAGGPTSNGHARGEAMLLTATVVAFRRGSRSTPAAGPRSSPRCRSRSCRSAGSSAASPSCSLRLPRGHRGRRGDRGDPRVRRLPSPGSRRRGRAVVAGAAVAVLAFKRRRGRAASVPASVPAA